MRPKGYETWTVDLQRAYWERLCGVLERRLDQELAAHATTRERLRTMERLVAMAADFVGTPRRVQ